MSKLRQLLEILVTDKPILIQTHDFPDYDAIMSAYGLSQLLENYGIDADICYRGTIQSLSLNQSIQRLNVAVREIEACGEMQAQIIAIDGVPPESSAGELVALIDHHNRNGPFPYAFSDVRVDYGACATIVWEYFREEHIKLDRNLATALLMAIMMDTAFMTRGVSKADLEAFSDLFFRGDWELSSKMLRNSLSVKDLGIFHEAIQSYKLFKFLAFIVIKKPCTPEVQALVADYFLGLREVTVAVVVTQQGADYRVSVRSEDKIFPSDEIIHNALEGIGQGGGHLHMGGGIIFKDSFPGMQQLGKRFRKAVEI